MTQGKITLVDDADYAWLMQWTWSAVYLGTIWYAKRKQLKSEGVSRKSIFIHREIMNNPPDQIDHINGDGLDNQRSNLRHATNQQNSMNKHRSRGTSQYKGVYWRSDRHKWQAAIGVNNQVIYLGYYNSEVDAARAYDRASLEHFGEFANPNFEHLGS